MRSLPRAFVLVAALAALFPACENTPNQPQQSPDGTTTITGRERIGWDQQAPDAAEIAQYSYVIYVDNVAVLLPLSTCGALAGDGPTAACSSPLPSLTPGRHTLELAARITRGGAVLESARSTPPLVVTVSGSLTAGAATPGSSGSGQSHEMRGPDGTRYLAQAVAAGLDTPSAMAILPGGRMLIAERGGSLRVAEEGVLLDAPAATLDAADTREGESASIAVAADFPTSRHVYVSYTAIDRDGTRVGRVVRFRELGGILGEPAVIIDDLPAGSSAPRIRIGPDGALYAATAASDPRDAGDLGSYAGKILRFTKEGAASPDNPLAPSPVFSSGHTGRLDFDWEPESKVLWHVEMNEAGVTIGRAGPSRDAADVSEGYLDRIRAVAATFYAGEKPAAWKNSLFLASPDQQCIFRASNLSSIGDESGGQLKAERLLAGTFGSIGAILAAEDGLYIATANGSRDEAGRPTDTVYLLRQKELSDLPVPRGAAVK